MARYAAAGLPHIRTNAEAPASVLEEIAQPDTQGLKLLRDAAENMRLSAPGYHRRPRGARTLADLDGADKIGRLHLAEALSYRALAEDLRRAACFIDGLVRWCRCVNSPVTSFVYILPTISPGVFSGLIVERVKCHVAFQNSGLGRSIDFCRYVCARRVVARPAPLHRNRQHIGPDRFDSLARPASRQFHRRSLGSDRAGPDCR